MIQENIISRINNELIELNRTHHKNNGYMFAGTTSCYHERDSLEYKEFKNRTFIGKESAFKSIGNEHIKLCRITTDYPDMDTWACGFRIGIQNMDDKKAEIKNHCDYLVKYKLLEGDKYYLDYHEEHLADHFLNWLDPSHKIASIKE